MFFPSGEVAETNSLLNYRRVYHEFESRPLRYYHRLLDIHLSYSIDKIKRGYEPLKKSIFVGTDVSVV